MGNEVELTPTGLKASNKEGILNLGRSRMRAIYYRQVDDGSWQATDPLPADPASQALYFGKGFKAKPPADASPPVVASTEVLTCSCGFEAKSKFGLQAHQRKHEKEEK